MRKVAPKVPSTDRAADRRKREITLIHVARSQLGLDEETYRALIAWVSAQHGQQRTSSADLDDRQRAAVLDEFKRRGFVDKRPGHGRGRYPGKPLNAGSSAMPEMITKVEALLADMGLAWAYADAIVRRMFHIDRVAWCRDPEQLRALIAALYNEQEKRQLSARIDRQLLLLEIDAVSLVDLLRPLRPKWRTHRPSLRLVSDHLAGLIFTRGLKEPGQATRP